MGILAKKEQKSDCKQKTGGRVGCSIVYRERTWLTQHCISIIAYSKGFEEEIKLRGIFKGIELNCGDLKSRNNGPYILVYPVKPIGLKQI